VLTAGRGALGSEFTLRATGFHDGELVTVAIAATSGKRTNDQTRIRGPGDVTVTVRYTPQETGTYAVGISSDRGLDLRGEFSVTSTASS
jgi:hypothetical protein